MVYQFFLPMVLRWRASRAEAPLSTVYENTFESLRELEKLAHQLMFPGHFSFCQTSTHVSTT